MSKIKDTSRLVGEAIVDYLKDTKQESLLPEVEAVLEQKTRKEKKIKSIVITSVVELLQNQSDQITKLVKKHVSSDIPTVYKIDKDIIGGFTVEVGDWYLDASLKKDLDRLKEYLLT